MYTARFSADGRRVVTASRDHTVRIWDVESGKRIGDPLIGHTDQVEYAEFDSDGKRIISSSIDGTIRIWDISTFHHVGSMRARNIPYPMISNIGPLRLKIDSSKFSICYDEEGSKVGPTVVAHTQRIESKSFSPDGRYVVTASYDTTAKVWDVQSSKQVGPTLEHFEGVDSARFTPDGSKIITETANDYIMIWDWTPLQELVDQTRERFKHRELTPQERQKYYLD